MSSTTPQRATARHLLLSALLCFATLASVARLSASPALADGSGAPCGIGGIDAYGDTSHGDDSSLERCSIKTSVDQAGLIHVHIDRPVVNHDSFDYIIFFQPGDLITIVDAGGCVQTGGSGGGLFGEGTWKRYANSDPQDGPPTKYYGTIKIPDTPVQSLPILNWIGKSVGIPPLSQLGDAGEFQGSAQGQQALHLTLGYIDDQYDDNGYYNHDDGESDQCSQDPAAADGGDGGAAYVDLTIKPGGADGTAAINASAWDLVPDDYQNPPNPYDANGIYRNPRWGWEVNNAPGGSGGYPVDCYLSTSCLSQFTSVDSPPWWVQYVPFLCRPNVLPQPPRGHRNWFDATYTGTVQWDGHSNPTFGDDDYNIELYTPQVGTLVDNTPIAAGGASEHLRRVELEFNSEETIDNFGYNLWWSHFRGHVDTGDTAAGQDINGHDAVAVGLMGVDEVHGQSEVHPVHALAIREAAQPQLSDDAWAIFVRNWGNEGTCSSNDHFLDATAITIKIPRPPGVPANVVPRSISQQLLGYNVSNGQVSMWSAPSGVYVTFHLPPGDQHGTIAGELNLDWTGSVARVSRASRVSAMARDARPHPVARTIRPLGVTANGPTDQEPEDIMAGIYGQLSPAQQSVDQQLLAQLSPQAAPPSPTLMQLVTSSTPPPAPNNVPTVSEAPDPAFVQQMEDRFHALCAATGGNMPTQPGVCGALSSNLHLAPITTLSLAGGQPVVSGWYTTPVTATLTPYDASGSGIAFTQYSYDGQNWTTYTGPFTLPDGVYTFYYRSQDNTGNLEETRQQAFKIDTIPPAITINQPQATNYTHSSTLTLDYRVVDGNGQATGVGAGSGVASFMPTMDGAPTVDGNGLASGQAINLLTEMSLGSHTFEIDAVDNVGHASSKSITFTIIVTPQSIIQDVKQFFAAGDITQDEATSLLSKLQNAARLRAAGDCVDSAGLYQAFINELQAQSGKHVDPTAASIMVQDAQYLIAHCP